MTEAEAVGWAFWNHVYLQCTLESTEVEEMNRDSFRFH